MQAAQKLNVQGFKGHLIALNGQYELAAESNHGKVGFFPGKQKQYTGSSGTQHSLESDKRRKGKQHAFSIICGGADHDPDHMPVYYYTRRS